MKKRRDILAENYEPTHDLEMLIKEGSVEEIHECIVNAFKAGFDSANQPSEEQPRPVSEGK